MNIRKQDKCNFPEEKRNLHHFCWGYSGMSG